MTIHEILGQCIEKGVESDFRTRGEVLDYYWKEEVSGPGESFINPYADSGYVWVEDPGREVKRVMIGIDISENEVHTSLEWERLTGNKIDLIISHHPRGKLLVSFPHILKTQLGNLNMDKKIYLTWGIGEGETSIAAFDRALWDAGIANYNIVYLSSVIPSGFQIEVGKLQRNNVEYGHKLYAVVAKAETEQLGDEAWAGLGWSYTKDENPAGIFVEEIGTSEHEVGERINKSLHSIFKHRHEIFKEKKGAINSKITGIACTGNPVCAIVAAVYESEPFHPLIETTNV